MITWQWSPVNPGWQVQVQSDPSGLQIPRLRQGKDSQGFKTTSQKLPLNPGEQAHLKPYKINDKYKL